MAGASQRILVVSFGYSRGFWWARRASESQKAKKCPQQLENCGIPGRGCFSASETDDDTEKEAMGIFPGNLWGGMPGRKPTSLGRLAG